MGQTSQQHIAVFTSRRYFSTFVWPSPRQTPGPYTHVFQIGLHRRSPEACQQPFGMVQSRGSRQERIRWTGFSAGSRATCPYRRSWRSQTTQATSRHMPVSRSWCFHAMQVTSRSPASLALHFSTASSKALARILLDRVHQKLFAHQPHGQSGFTSSLSVSVASAVGCLQTTWISPSRSSRWIEMCSGLWAVRCDGTISDYSLVGSGVGQVCVLAPHISKLVWMVYLAGYLGCGASFWSRECEDIDIIWHRWQSWYRWKFLKQNTKNSQKTRNDVMIFIETKQNRTCQRRQSHEYWGRASVCVCVCNFPESKPISSLLREREIQRKQLRAFG